MTTATRDEEDELRAMRHELAGSTYNAGISECASHNRAIHQAQDVIDRVTGETK